MSPIFGLARIVSAAAFTAFWSRGVKARSACCTRLPSCASTLSGTSSGFCVTKYTPTPLLRTSRTTSSMRSTSAVRRVLEQQVRLVEEEHQLGLVEVAHLGQRLEQLGQHPQQEGGVQARRVQQLVGRQDVDHALALDRLHEVADVEHRLAEELVAALFLDLQQPALDGADRWPR